MISQGTVELEFEIEEQDTLYDIERKVILLYLKAFENNKTKTAKALGIGIRTLQRKLIIYRKMEEDAANKGQM